MMPPMDHLSKEWGKIEKMLCVRRHDAPLLERQPKNHTSRVVGRLFSNIMKFLMHKKCGESANMK